MNRIFLLLLSLFFFAETRAQLDTIFYDKDWKGVPSRSFATYYRIVTGNQDPNYKQMYRDFYISGELQGEGGYISIDKYDDTKSVFDGNIISYFQTGQVGQRYRFVDGKLDGEYITYYDNGLVRDHCFYTKGLLNGTLTQFSEDGNFCIQMEYVNNNPKYDYYYMSDQNGNMTKYKIADNTPIWEIPTMHELQFMDIDGEEMSFYEKNGLFIGAICTKVNDYGSYYRIKLFISNGSMETITINPARMSSILNGKNGEIDRLHIQSLEDYLKKIKKSQTWAAALRGWGEGWSSSSAGVSTSTTTINNRYNGTIREDGYASAYGSGGAVYGNYTGDTKYSGGSTTTITTQSYDAAVAYQERVLSRQRMIDFKESLFDERRAKEEGYLKMTKISSGESIYGYVNIERKKGYRLGFTISIEGVAYPFSWNVDKL